MTLLLFILGGALLIGGAELLVRGASRLAVAAGVSPLVVGLTVVAFGTSSPELAVGVGAALTGAPDVAVGNVVGSNVANVLLILGLSAAIAPLLVARQVVRLEVPLMIGVSLAVFALAFDGRVGPLEGGLLVLGLVAYVVFTVRRSRREEADRRGLEPAAAQPAATSRGGHWARDALSIAAGLGLLVVGARWLVAGAIAAAGALGVSELVVGLTVVAIGTSLPELATSVLASLRGERDLAVGNVVGSNLFNLLGVLGAAAAVSAEGVPVAPAALAFDLPVMLATSVACLPILFTGYAIARWEGWAFLAYYGAYLGYLFLAAAEHDALPLYSAAMTLFVLPLTVLTLLVLTARSWREGRARR
jgi:cation:H+ antiporter